MLALGVAGLKQQSLQSFRISRPDGSARAIAPDFNPALRGGMGLVMGRSLQTQDYKSPSAAASAVTVRSSFSTNTPKGGKHRSIE